MSIKKIKLFFNKFRKANDNDLKIQQKMQNIILNDMHILFIEININKSK